MNTNVITVLFAIAVSAASRATRALKLYLYTKVTVAFVSALLTARTQ